MIDVAARIVYTKNYSISLPQKQEHIDINYNSSKIQSGFVTILSNGADFERGVI
ncbi:MAG: hypothetical protein LLG09_02910 [Negativicutes bacterium]|nr:hypothetical protein [Negativicutes bacterium]